MSDATNPETFEAIVEWAYSTLPPKIRELPDFPGIQVADEPPEEILKKRNWPRRREMLGCYSGIRRTASQHTQLRMAPDLIFVFRGPIVRCSRGDLRAEVKEVIWHEVAHWIGHDEAEVKELGLATLSSPEEGVRRRLESIVNNVDIKNAPKTPQQRLEDTSAEIGEALEQPLRCVKCYSADVSCREIDKPISSSETWLSDPLCLHATICTCKSCGYEWDDEDNA